ncbi:hypothetical protein E3O25_05855 [Cryobacterium sp. TMT1-3]|uniref:Uncharacterized protein n=1 Tax=Cryobacterium luteum TaxID=1424661 RepID=A0A1H8J1Y8_9MICO|nr:MULTISPECIES: hypothetical protein [Cryobacterium]TFB93284.1 hypothetical protein E3O10_03150 [Cryobacterium luteum]TFC28725.1 hypothetical protein E3O25_05855 [Cryobacterium sp. TMT1-3]SEN74669.1 hypothetical protein SAMN05216281_11338 [Cryobacterium luteum]
MHLQTPLPRGFDVGAFTYAEARAAGASAKRLRSRDIEHPFWGVCVAAGSIAELNDRCRAIRQRMPVGAFFSHVTAARLFGMPLPAKLEADPLLHVTVLDPHRALRAVGVVGHRVAIPPGLGSVAGLPVLEPVSAWCQLASVLDLNDLVAAGDHLLRPELGLATAPEISAQVVQYAGQRGARSLRAAEALIRPRVESRRETFLRLFLVLSGFPEPETNVYIPLPAGKRRVRGDLVYFRYKVLVEYDGEQHRTDDGQYNRDAERLHDLRGAGWLVVTVRKGSSKEWIRAAVDGALRSRGWRP